MAGIGVVKALILQTLEQLGLTSGGVPVASDLQAVTDVGAVTTAVITVGGISSPAAGAQAEMFGAGASVSGAITLAVGDSAATTGNHGVALGANASAVGSAIGIGSGTFANGVSSLCIGRGANAASFQAAQCYGHSATATAANQVVFGATTVPILEFQTGTSANSAFLSIKTNTELLATTSGATATTSGLIPPGVSVLHVASFVETTVVTSSGTDTFDTGDAGVADRYGAAIAGAQGTIQDETNYTADPAGVWSASGREVILEAPGAETFTAGAVRVTVWYTQPSAPTS